MAFSFLNAAAAAATAAATAATNIYPYKVRSNDPDGQSKGIITQTNDCVTLYKQSGYFEAVLYNPKDCPGKSFSLFRLNNVGEAATFFASLAPKIVVLCKSSQIYKQQMLQEICDCIRYHPTWHVSHVAAHVGLTGAFQIPAVSGLLKSTCTITGVTPLMVAVKTENRWGTVKELLDRGAQLDMADSEGNTVYHHVVQYAPDVTVLKLLGKNDQKCVINWLDGKGQTALHLACSLGNVACTETLLQMGADINVTACSTKPIHAAMKVNDIESAKKILEKYPDQLHVVDSEYGYTPLHWAKTKEAVELCVEKSCDINATGRLGDTALHVMLEWEHLECIRPLLCHGIDMNIPGKGGNTPLHLAVMKDDVDLVQLLLVFGANVDIRNDKKQTARHLVATSKLKNRDVILYILHMVGGQRCAVDVKGCLEGCVLEGRWHGKPDKTLTYLMEMNKHTVDDVLDAALSGAHSMPARSLSMPEVMFPVVKHCTGDRVLCLDGGGIRGLVLIQVLLAIEKAAGQPIRDCFDWVGGTSTGGILALGIALGKSLQQILGMYFGLKDHVFVGNRPYSVKPLEALLKKELGETVKMSDIKHPKVLVTGVLADRFPPELHMFRNYIPPVVYRPTSEGPMRTTPPPPHEQLIWQAARCSGAAPTYFPACGPFLDGGLMSNNPTLDVLTEIHEYNTGLKANNQHDQVHPIGVVVSLGTGKIPIVPVNTVDVFRPAGIFDMVKLAQGFWNFIKVLEDQATVAEGRPNDRARAWCSMINVPYFRFSPQLSEDVPLDGRDDKAVIKMMWDTQCYIAANKAKILKLGSLLAANACNSASSKEPCSS